MNEPRTIILNKTKDCKGSVRYDDNTPDSPLASIYISRKAWPVMPQQVKVTIEGVK